MTLLVGIVVPKIIPVFFLDLFVFFPGVALSQYFSFIEYQNPYYAGKP